MAKKSWQKKVAKKVAKKAAKMWQGRWEKNLFLNFSSCFLETGLKPFLFLKGNIACALIKTCLT